MKTLQNLYEFPLTLRVPKNAFVLVAPEPATVTQRTVDQHFGIPPTTYKRMVRDGFFPTKRIGRLIVASYDDVKRALTEGAVARAQLHDAVKSAETKEDKEPMSVEAARAYMQSSRTKAEERERKKEIDAIASELLHKYGETLDDDSPNPNHDPRLEQHGTDLLLASMGLRRKGDAPSASRADRPGGYYRQCCWCERPAFATKQTWMGEYWSGGPVCEQCAQHRGPKERVVQIETQTILYPAEDQSVPTEYHLPRRRKKRR